MKEALVNLVKKGNIRRLKTILDAGADINGTDWQGHTALIKAASKRNKEMLLFLLEYGADVNIRTPKYHYTALLELLYPSKWGPAITEQRAVDMTRALLEKGADVNAADCEGDTALMYATRQGWIEVVRLLLEHGADINMKNRSKDTALNCTYGRLEIEKLLQSYAAKMKPPLQQGNREKEDAG